MEKNQFPLNQSHHISYIDEGSGDPIVLLHGFCGSSDYWENIIPALSKSYRVIAPDLSGHGHSSDIAGAYLMESFVDDLVPFFDYLGLQQFTLIGHSLGGYITLAYAEKYRDKLVGLGLIHSTAYPDSDQGKENRDKSVASIEEKGMEDFIASLIPKLFGPFADSSDVEKAKDIGMLTNSESAIATLIGMRDRKDRQSVLHEYGGPILLVAGEHDNIIAPEKTFTVEGEKVTQVTLEKSAHMSMYEAPEQLLECIQHYLKNIHG